jgi:guanyl-specific ribonuclease Sa
MGALRVSVSASFTVTTTASALVVLLCTISPGRTFDAVKLTVPAVLSNALPANADTTPVSIALGGCHYKKYS